MAGGVVGARSRSVSSAPEGSDGVAAFVMVGAAALDSREAALGSNGEDALLERGSGMALLDPPESTAAGCCMRLDLLMTSSSCSGLASWKGMSAASVASTELLVPSATMRW